MNVDNRMNMNLPTLLAPCARGMRHPAEVKMAALFVRDNARERLSQCPCSYGTVTTVEPEPVLSARSTALTTIVYCRPSKSFPCLEACSEIVNE